jgi:hypothetical protein
VSPTEAEGFPAETIVSDGTQTSGSRVLRGDQGPAYAEGWRDCALSLAAEFDRRADRPGPAVAIGAVIGAAEVARRYAQNGPGARASAGPVSPDPGDGSVGLSAPPETIPLFDTEGNPPS